MKKARLVELTCKNDTLMFTVGDLNLYCSGWIQRLATVLQIICKPVYKWLCITLRGWIKRKRGIQLVVSWEHIPLI